MSWTCKIAFQVVAVTVFSAGVALIINAAREDSLPLLTTFQPEQHCSSAMEAGPGLALGAALASFGKKGTVFVDARREEDYRRGHIRGAVNIPYSFLEPVPEDALDRLRSYKRVVVYCDTEEARTSQIMAGEIYRAGIKNAFYLQGGLLAWAKAGGSVTGETPKDRQ